MKQRDAGGLDPGVEEYLAIVSDEGIWVGDAQEGVSRRRAVAAAIRVRSMFQRWSASLCDDAILPMEEIGKLLSATDQGVGGFEEGSASRGGADSVRTGAGDNPIFPTDEDTPPVASPVAPQ